MRNSRIFQSMKSILSKLRRKLPWLYNNHSSDYVSHIQTTVAHGDISATEIGVVDSLGDLRGLARSDDHLFTTDRSRGIVHAIVDDINGPSLLDTVSVPGDSANKIATQNGVAYVTLRDYGGLAVIDISDPSSMLLYGHSVDGDLTNAYGVAVEGEYAYVADRDGSVGIFDISEPNTPAWVVSISDQRVLSGATGIAYNDSYVYVAVGGLKRHNQNQRVVAIDVSDSTDPSIVDEINDEENLEQADAIAIKDDHAFVGGWEMARLTVVDISDPTDISIVETDVTDDMEECFQIDTISVSGTNYAFCSAKGVEEPLQEEGGIVVYDITEPTDVEKIGTITLANGANMHGCLVSREKVYGLSSNDGALSVIRWEDKRSG